MKTCHPLQHLCCTSPFLATLNMFMNILGYHKVQFITTVPSWTSEKWARYYFWINFFYFKIWRITSPLVWGKQTFWIFLLHNSLTNDQIYSNSASNFKLDSLLTLIFLLYSSHSNSYLGHPVYYIQNFIQMQTFLDLNQYFSVSYQQF